MKLHTLRLTANDPENRPRKEIGSSEPIEKRRKAAKVSGRANAGVPRLNLLDQLVSKNNATPKSSICS